ncbi:MAG: type II toxin-antitoxin system RelE/ParE family toxin [Burkholderiaceae bacterium]|jgi:phage-related protein|nr:type II toxin-antitoxin system RelE/ParE family toxin [Burkholderiaceae bacterium]
MSQKVIQARFYRTESGTEPVREWLKELPAEERYEIGHDIRLVELGWPIGMPVCRPLGDGLFEVRTKLENRIARVLFCIAEGQMWLLHGFIKTTQKISQQDMQLAHQRRKQLSGGHS